MVLGLLQIYEWRFLKKTDDWRQCPGDGGTDIQAGECTEKCSTGYYLGTTAQLPSEFDAENETQSCKRCRTTC